MGGCVAGGGGGAGSSARGGDGGGEMGVLVGGHVAGGGLAIGHGSRKEAGIIAGHMLHLNEYLFAVCSLQLLTGHSTGGGHHGGGMADRSHTNMEPQWASSKVLACLFVLVAMNSVLLCLNHLCHLWRSYPISKDLLCA